MMENKKRVIEIIILLLIIGNAFFAYNYFNTKKELSEIKSGQNAAQVNTKVIDFATLFIKKVLQADKEVDFETRLALENAVRELNDEEIMAEWQNFVGSKTEAVAQASVKKLLEILITKIRK